MKSPLLASMQETFKLVKAGQWEKATHTIQRALGAKIASKHQTFTEKTKSQTPDTPTNPTPEPSTPNEAPAGLGTLGSLFKAFQSSFKPVIPDPIPPQAQFITKTFTNDYGSRDYKLYIPSTYNAKSTKPIPLVIMLHGCTQSSDDFANGTQMNALAEQHQLLIAYPEQSAQVNVQRCWNWFKSQDQIHNQGEPSLIAGITQTIMQDYRVDKKRVYIAGLSAGGAMSAIMAALYPNLYSAVGIHSGLAFGSAQSFSSALMAMNLGIKPIHKPSQFVPLIIFQGDQDKTVSVRNADILFEQAKTLLQEQQANVSFKLCTQENAPPDSYPYTYTVLEDSQGAHEIEYWKIHGAGHAWSGGESSGSYTDSKGPHASKEMLRFFLSHTLSS